MASGEYPPRAANIHHFRLDAAMEGFRTTHVWCHSQGTKAKIKMQKKNINSIGEPETAENKPQQLYTPEEVGQTLGLCSATVKNWIRTRKIKALRLGANVLRVTESELCRFQQEAAA